MKERSLLWYPVGVGHAVGNDPRSWSGNACAGGHF